jgi:hypothetical protein
LVGITPCQTLTGGDEVKLVAMWAVTVDHDQQEDGERGRHRADLPDCKPRSLHPRHLTSFSELLAQESLAAV